VITLAASFLSGVFVPQEFLGAGLLRFAQFLPTYWYVRANNQIAEVTRLNLDGPLLQSLAMQLAFGLAFLSLALAIAKNRRRPA